MDYGFHDCDVHYFGCSCCVRDYIDHLCCNRAQEERNEERNKGVDFYFFL